MYALARRGLEVYGVDTADVAPQVLALPNVHHLRTNVGALRWEELPPAIDWLLLDVNLAPQVALHEVARLMPRLKKHLRGAVLTLKLNDWKFVDELRYLWISEVGTRGRVQGPAAATQVRFHDRAVLGHARGRHLGRAWLLYSSRVEGPASRPLDPTTRRGRGVRLR